MEFNHIPVLLEESIEMLNLSDASIVLDATFGHGGHTEKILESIGPKGHVNANDRDMSTKMHYERLLKKYNNLSMTNFSFSNLEDISTSSGIKAFDAILIDIGVSSEQFDNANRGFSFQNDGPLDMRMDNRQELDAGVVVNTFSQAELEKIFIEYGEEWRGKKISEYIVKERENNIIKTTGQLSQLVEKII
ncbi:16S rRNA (cytosine(1402)-N(4))-methyltransferase RsmH, partial [bacterium]|nr:16S rRNA (cytosine(1402)-N(4))-methyltransferase RsmH [bacterium]